ncbi:MAG: MFS transporter [Moraxellaceae bacterium]|nr:MAG: MFS transporter [Moraxellaceae bacterium]
MFANCSAPVVVFVGSIVGGLLAPNTQLATLPIALFIVGVATSTIPSAMLMKRIGRKKVFLGAGGMGVLAAVLAGQSVHAQLFWCYCAAVFFLGLTNAVVQQYRFAAMESMPADKMTQAASRVLLGGVVAAFMGPELALLFKDSAGNEYAGSFYVLAVILCVAWLVLLIGYREVPIESSSTEGEARPLRSIFRQPVLWVAISAAGIAFAVMSLIMTATPISMHVVNGHSLADTKWVIQSHIAAMFLPSLFTAWLVQRVGVAGIMMLGLLALLATVVIGYWDQHLMHYWVSLVLLGIGWNFLFIGGTVLLPQSYTDSERFKVQATNDMLVFSAQAVVSVMSGWLLFSVGWQMLLLLCLPLMLIQCLVVAYWKFRVETV